MRSAQDADSVDSGSAATPAASDIGYSYVMLPANGLDADLRRRPSEIPAKQLAACSSVEDYSAYVLTLDIAAEAGGGGGGGGAAAAAAAAAAPAPATGSRIRVRFVADTGRGRGRGLIATEALKPDVHIFAERGVVVMESQHDKVENAINFAFAVERMQNAPLRLLLDLHNAFEPVDDEERNEVNVIGSEVLAEQEALRPRLQQQRMSVSQLNELVGIYCSNAMALTSQSTCGVFPLMAMLNHSCDPNCEFTSRAGGSYIRAFTTRDVKEGEELVQSYLSENDLSKGVEERQVLLLEGFGFVCMCRRCVLETIELHNDSESAEGEAQSRDNATALHGPSPSRGKKKRRTKE